jgi:hypothetical protein
MRFVNWARWRPLAGFAAALVLFAGTKSPSGQTQTAFPGPLNSFLSTVVKLTPEQQRKLQTGQPVTQLLDTDPAREVAIFGAVWVQAPVGRYLAAVKDIETFEQGDNFLITKRISSPPRLEDFDRLSLQPDDVADLRTCKIGKCELKLDEGALTRIQKDVDWSKPGATADAERTIRKLALEYVTGYQEGGNSRLAAYRDGERPTFVGQEFAAMIDRMPFLATYLPDLRKYLLDYPKATLPNAESILYWQEVKFGLKPTVRINHLTVANAQAYAAVVSKMLYANHYFWTALELRILVPDPGRGEGFWFANINRSRSDGLGGFVGSLIRGKVRGEADKGMQAALTITKNRMEHR